MEFTIEDKTILIVDDVPENIDILSGLLKDFRRKVASNGEQALALVRGNDPPDLILLDIEMPGLDGFQVCQLLHEDPATTKIPVIFLTASMDKKETVKGFSLGAVDFMNKPYYPDELMVRIRTQLELKDAREKMEELVQQLEMSSSLLKNSSEELMRQKKSLEQERNKASALLLNVLPEYIAQELKEKGSVVPRNYPVVSMLFTDLSGFTRLSKGLSPELIVEELNKIFVGFDEIVENWNMEKIKTLGDGYMAAGGLPIQNSTNPIDAVSAGLEMIEFVRKVRDANRASGKPLWELRIGIHTGQVVAGVIGKNKFTYDVWGATVNTASRMEAASDPGKLNITGVTYQLVKDKFNCTHRGSLDVKNMGRMDMYFVDELQPSGVS